MFTNKRIVNLMGYYNTCQRPVASQVFNFVPKHAPVLDEDIINLQNFVNDCAKLLVITGAGISTESGIPDYRSEEVGLYVRSNHRPIQYQDFLKSAAVRKRYWARNFIGWPRFSSRLPNIAHISIAKLEENGKVCGVITQNVDGLHSKAGSRNIVELHGSAFRVVCLNCPATYLRHEIQKQLIELNPSLSECSDTIRPDGDVEIAQDTLERFKPLACPNCGASLKPDITFFGDNVPLERVETVRNLVTKSDSILVIGSSLSVFSGYRIILQAADERKNVAIINIGQTRADHLAHLKISAKCSDILSRIC